MGRNMLSLSLFLIHMGVSSWKCSVTARLLLQVILVCENRSVCVYGQMAVAQRKFIILILQVGERRERRGEGQ